MRAEEGEPGNEAMYICVFVYIEASSNAVDGVYTTNTHMRAHTHMQQENKEIALGTSKLNYLDPRISVAWCRKWDVPVEKIYNKTQREKFAWAIDMADEEFVF